MQATLAMSAMAIVAAGPATCVAATFAYDFDAVTALAAGAIDGQYVGRAVPGYELRLLKDGAVVYSQAFGDFERGRVVNVDSSTKTIAGGLVMSIAERSARPFSLDTRISEYVPTFAGEKSAITIRQAFSHTSGLGASNAVANGAITLQQAAATIGLQSPVSYGPPGTQFSYGGTSMHAAGAAAEAAGGASWNALFAERITGPLGMSSTRFVLSGPNNPRIAGGVESNAADFGRYMDMLANDGVDRATGTRVLSTASVEAIFTRQSAADVTLVNSPLPGSTDYGVGIWLDQRAADGALTGAVAGGARGFCSWIDLDDDIVGVIATESTSFSNIRELQYLIRDAVEDALRSPRLAGDADRNGSVNFADLVVLAQNYNQSTVKTWGTGDFTGDGAVNFADLVALAQNYGNSPASFSSEWALAQSVVPEPMAASVVLSATVALRRQRRAKR